MRQSTYIHASRTEGVIARWRGMGAVLAVAFYSLFFATHQRLVDTPIYVQNQLLFGAETHSIFTSLSAERQGDHSQIRAEHPAFTLWHHVPAQLLTEGWQRLGLGSIHAQKHGIALLTCLAGALTVVMVYHALLWSGAGTLTSILLATACGAGPCLWLTAPLPEVWIFAGLGVAALAAMTARGPYSPWWLHLLVATYAMSCFVGSIIPVFILALVRCARESSLHQRFVYQPLLIALAAVTLTFGLANLQRVIYPLSAPLPSTLAGWKMEEATWSRDRQNAGRVAREVFLTNIVAPQTVLAQPNPAQPNQRQITLAEADWTRLNLEKGLSAAWLLLLALSFAGLIWRAQLDPFALGIIGIIIWNIAALPWYGSPDKLLIHACLWTPAVVIAAGLGLDRSLEHWPKLRIPVIFLLIAFVTAQITRNWMFIEEVLKQLKR